MKNQLSDVGISTLSKVSNVEERITCSVPTALPLLNIWQRLSPKARRAVTKQTAESLSHSLTLSWVGRNRARPISRCEIRVVRFCASGKMPDPDGLLCVYKPLLDALVVQTGVNPHGLGVILDDTSAVVSLYPVTAERCRRGEERTVMTILVISRTTIDVDARARETAAEIARMQTHRLAKKSKSTDGALASLPDRMSAAMAAKMLFPLLPSKARTVRRWT